MTRRLLTYRCGTFTTFFEAMRASLRAAQPSWNVSMDHFLGGYLAAWAEVCDILTFYQERIAREGYLETAEEERSVRWLARQVGYQPAPGLSATVPVSFRFTGVRARGAKGQVVPKGSVLQSIPSGGGPPVQFETTADLEALPTADSIALQRDVSTPSPSLTAGAVTLRVNRNVQVEVGQTLLLVGAASDPEVAGQLWFCGPITAVESDPLQPARLLRWSSGVSGPLAARSTTAIEAYVFGGRARLFGFRARPWNVVPDSIRNPIGHRAGGVIASVDEGNTWVPSNQSLPGGHWQAVAASGDVRVVGGPAGAYRSVFGGPWMATPLRGRPVLSLIATPAGDFLAGSTGGAMYRSVDGGETWSLLPAVLKGERHWWIFREPQLPFPQVGIRALLAVSHGGAVTYCAGTDTGFFTSTDGLTWQPASHGLPGWNEDTGQSQTAIFGLTAEEGSRDLYAATQHGLFHAAHPGASWHLVGPHLGPKESLLHRLFHRGGASEHPPAVFSVAVAKDASGSRVLLAGTAAGILRSAGGGEPWTVVVATGESKALLAVSPSLILAGAGDQLLRSEDAGVSWREVPQTVVEFSLQSATLALDADLLAAFRREGFRLSASATIDSSGTIVDAGNGWRFLTTAVKDGGWTARLQASAPALALASSGATILAAGPAGSVLENEWPGLGASSGDLDLDDLEPPPPPGSWAVASEQDPVNKALPFLVEASGTVARTGFGSSRTVTRLEPRGNPDFSLLDPRAAVVELRGRALPLFQQPSQPPPVAGGNTLTLAGDFSTWHAGRTVIVTGARPRVLIDAELGGIAIWNYKDGSPSVRTFGDSEVRALAVYPDGALAVALDDGSIWRQAPTGFSTPAEALPAPPFAVHALAVKNGTLWAGGEKALQRLDEETHQWLEGGLSDVSVNSLAAGEDLYAGTDDGVYSLDSSGKWTQAGLKTKTVLYLAAGKSNLVAGLEEGGVFAQASDSKEWTPVGSDSEFLRPSALAVAADGTVAIAAEGGGIFRREPGKQTLVRVDKGLPMATISAVAFDEAGILYAAPPGWGLAKQTADGWTAMGAGVSNVIAALQPMPGGGVVSAARRAMSGLSPIASPALRTPVGTLPVNVVADLDAGLYSPALQEALEASGIQLTGVSQVSVIDAGKRWRILAAAPETWYLRRGPSSVSVFRDGVVSLLRPPSPPQDGGAWLLDTGELYPNAGELAATVAAAGAAMLSEPAVLSERPAFSLDSSGAPVTVLTFSNPLANAYDAGSVRVAGNTVVAVQGETVYQILGSGDAGSQGQAFPLQRTPLSVLAGQPGDGIAPRISVYLTAESGQAVHPRSRLAAPLQAPAVEWRRVDSLLSAGPSETVYALEADDAGTLSRVRFGDGVHGARLPTGRENVSARYAVGAGESGNVGAGQIAILRSGPPGLMRVKNLMAATGGVAPEPGDRIRERAPLPLRAMNRVVSMRDYAAYASVFPGIEHAVGAVLHHHKSFSLALTVSGEGNVPPGAGLLKDLTDAINAARATAEPFQAVGYRPVPFHLHLRVSADGSVDPAQALAELRAVLTARYGLKAARFGQAVAASDIVAMTEEIPGIRNAAVSALYRSPGPVLRQARLSPASAEWADAPRAFPGAELLYLDVPAGLHITLETNL